MSSSLNNHKRQNIAVIGSGISGLAIAYFLSPHHNITVYEKNDYIGGHSRTIDINTQNGKVAVDTGFIVFNKHNYPLLTSLFTKLEVPVSKSNMSFGASIGNGKLEYATNNLLGLFAQRSNLINPKFFGMICDLLKFNKKAHLYLQSDPTITLGQCLDELKLGPWFKQYYLLAMGGAIWSTPIEQMLDFPAATFIRFFENHGLLSINDQPQWYTVKGGSREYVARLSAAFAKKIKLNCGANKVIRYKDHAIVADSQGNKEKYDAVVFACHADQALDIMENPSQDELEVLSNFCYQSNRIVLHSDITFMPKRKSAWASWVYLSDSMTDTNKHVSLSYWMNNLQPLNTKIPIIATLNPAQDPKSESIYDEYWFEHPVFDRAAIATQSRINEIQGQDLFWFCGAYQRYGFHEDGLQSAVAIAEKMGVRPSWI